MGSAPVISTPGRSDFASGVVYVVGKDKSVYAINLTTGGLIWKYALQGGGNPTGGTLWEQKLAYAFWASPAVSQGHIYVAGLDGVLRSFAPAA